MLLVLREGWMKRPERVAEETVVGVASERSRSRAEEMRALVVAQDSGQQSGSSSLGMGQRMVPAHRLEEQQEPRRRLAGSRPPRNIIISESSVRVSISSPVEVR